MSDVVERMMGGRYRLDDLLGEGGFGAVYSAEDTQLHRRVAIKLLDPSEAARSSEQAEMLRERFRREAVATASIDHPNVVTVFDVGLDEVEIYIVMELLSGHSLTEELERWPTGMPAHRALPLFLGALDGLAAGHRRGVVHKDLKPANLFISKPDSPQELLRVIDFGVARILHEQKLTATGRIVGTPRYLAPEYIEHLEVGPPLDVYQMGLILVEVLCGMPCVPRRLDLVTCCQRHMDGDLKIPHGLRGGEIGEVIARATRVDPAERFATAAEFAAALAEVDPATVSAEDAGGYKPTPRLGVKPLKTSTQRLHGGAAATAGKERPDDRNAARRHTRTAPTKRLGPAEEVMAALREGAPETPNPPEPAAHRAIEPAATPRAAARTEPTIDMRPDTAEMTPEDPIRAQRRTVYALIMLAVVSLVATAALLTLTRPQADSASLGAQLPTITPSPAPEAEPASDDHVPTDIIDPAPEPSTSPENVANEEESNAENVANEEERNEVPVPTHQTPKPAEPTAKPTLIRPAPAPHKPDPAPSPEPDEPMLILE